MAILLGRAFPVPSPYRAFPVDPVAEDNADKRVFPLPFTYATEAPGGGSDPGNGNDEPCESFVNTDGYVKQVTEP